MHNGLTYVHEPEVVHLSAESGEKVKKGSLRRNNHSPAAAARGHQRTNSTSSLYVLYLFRCLCNIDYYVRNYCCGKVMFYTCLSVILFTGVYTPLGRHPPGRHPSGQTPPPEQTPPEQTPPRQTPPLLRRPLQRTVRILLKCILVLNTFSSLHSPLLLWLILLLLLFQGQLCYGIST